MKIKAYKEAVKYLEGFIGKVIFKVDKEYLKHYDPLERMRVLLSLLGNPQEKFKSVLVGGTSGKGSTAYLISHILKTSGYKTGLTISPHLRKINERIQVNGQPVSDEQFLRIISSIVDTIELMKNMEVGAPSYFEILIAMAFKYFADEKVDIAVVEVGMGGKFDATNTLYPLVAVLTNVSLDHTNVLGKTVEKIAKTKVGIIKDHSSLRSLRQFKNFSNASVPAARYRSPRDTVAFGDSSEKFFHAKSPRELKHNLVVVTGVMQPSVIKIVEDRCKEVGAELFRFGKDFYFKIEKESLKGSVFDLTVTHDRGLQLNALRNLQLALLGKYQVENTSLAIETVMQLEKFGFKISEESIKKALETAFFPGRFEVIKLDTKILRYKDIKRKNKKDKALNILISQYPNIQIVLDGAHNPTKMKAFLKSLKKIFPKGGKIFIIAFKFDKDIPKMLRQIVKAADEIIITEFKAKTDMSQNASAEALNLKTQIANLKYKGEVAVEKDSKKALDKALSLSTIQQFSNSTIIVVTGSLYLVGEVRSYIIKNFKSKISNPK